MATRVACLLVATLVLGACRGDGGVERHGGAGGPVVSDSAGIVVVETMGEDRPLGWGVIPVASLAPPDSALTPVPWGVVADTDHGFIHVSDWTGSRVVTFDGSGAYVRTLGREGSGPGEFQSTSALTLDGDGMLVVWDAGRVVLSRWTPQGEFISEETAPLDYWGPGFAVVPAGMVTVTSAPSTGTHLEQRLVRQAGSSSAILHVVSLELVVMHLCGTFPAPRVLSPSVVWSSRGDTVYVHRGPGYRIDALADDRVFASFRRTVGPIRATEALAVQALESAPGPYSGFMRSCGVTAREMVAAVGHESTVSPVLGVTADPEGRLWIARTMDGLQPSSIDVLGADGGYLGTLDLPALPVAFPSDSTLVALLLGEHGQPELWLYRLDAASDGEPGTDQAADISGFRDCPGCPVMVELPPGRFLMGAAEGEMPAAQYATMPRWKEEAASPQVEVEIGYRLAMGRFEVTFDEWDRCVEAGGCSHRPDDAGWGRGDRPVIMVSRADAEEYAAWLGGVTGHPYRLPTEAEWEYAARAGTLTAHWWGDSPDPTHVACDGCGTQWDNRSSAPVGSFPANPFGLHDMLGNVSEWVADCWHHDLVGAPTDGSARVESSPWWHDGVCLRPVIRGGAFSHFPWAIRAANRSYWWPGPWTDRDSNSRGFRVARLLDGS